MTAVTQPDLITLRWDTSGWKALLVPARTFGVRHWRWSLVHHRAVVVKPRRALTERAAHRRSFRAWQKEISR